MATKRVGAGNVKRTFLRGILRTEEKKAPPGGPAGLFENGKLISVLASFCKLHVDAATVLIEVNVAFNSGMDGVVLADVNVVAGVPLGATLADDDVTGNDNLATKFLNAETFAA